MAVERLGHSTLIKDLVRGFQKGLLSRTLQGTEEQQLRHAHTVATNSVNAAALRAIAAIGTDCSLTISDKIKQVRAMVADTLQVLGVENHMEAHELDELMLVIQKLLSMPDFDVVYSSLTDRVLTMLDDALEDLAAGIRPTAEDPLDHLRQRVRVIIVKFRHSNPIDIDAVCDRINVAIGWQCCALGLSDEALPELKAVIDNIHSLLEEAQKQFASTA